MIDRGNEQESSERQFGTWPVVLSAWVVVLLFVTLLAAVSAVACSHGGQSHRRHLAGAVIPQHALCGGPGIASAPGVEGCERIPRGGDRSAYW
jgi:hypothetical protein